MQGKAACEKNMPHAYINLSDCGIMKWRHQTGRDWFDGGRALGEMAHMSIFPSSCFMRAIVKYRFYIQIFIYIISACFVSALPSCLMMAQCNKAS